MAKHRIFIDTNIILDVLCQRENCAPAATVLQLGATGDVELYMSNLTVANVIYITRKEIGKVLALLKMQQLCRFIHIAPCGQDETDKAFAKPNQTSRMLCRISRLKPSLQISSLPVMENISDMPRYL